MITLILLVAVLVGVVPCLSWINWAIGPLVEAAERRRLPKQFTIGDLLCLFVLIQLCTALVHLISIELFGLLLLDALVWMAIIAAWARGTGLLSRAGVRRGWHRVAFLLFALPCTFLSLIVWLFLPLVVFSGIDSGKSIRIVIAFLLYILTAVVFPFTRWFSGRVVQAADTKQQQAEEAA